VCNSVRKVLHFSNINISRKCRRKDLEIRAFELETKQSTLIIQGGAKERIFLYSACDFFVWGYFKSKVYFRKPRTFDDLKVSICEGIATEPQEMLVNVKQNFEERLRTCVPQEGHHLSDIIFRN